MPYFPAIVSRERVDQSLGGLDRSYSGVTANPNAFGAQVGQALQQLAGAGSQIAGGLASYDQEQREREGKERVANASAQTDLSRSAMAAMRDAPPDGTGVREATVNGGREQIEERIRNDPFLSKNPKYAHEYRIAQLSKLTSLGDQATSFEFRQKSQYATDELNKSLDTTYNRVRVDTSIYDQVLAEGKRAIEYSSGVPNADKPRMARAYETQLANARFEGMLSTAKTVEDLDKIKTELTSGPQADVWKQRISPANYEQLLKHIESGKKTIATQATAEARASIDGLLERSKDINQPPIPAEEITKAENLARASGNTILYGEVQRLKREEYIKSEAKGMTPAQIRQRANAEAGGPSSVYPNLPPELASGIAEATKAFPGVTPTYLGGTAMREYGANFPKRYVYGDPKFAAQAAPDKQVDMEGVLPAVRNGLSIAGEIYGQPLVITSGKRSHNENSAAGGAKGSTHLEGAGVDIRVRDKSPAERARIVDALVQAGFTGFHEDAFHIHADMRQGNVWAGEMASAETQAVLDRRKFASGADPAGIDRAGQVDVIRQRVGKDAQPVNWAVKNAKSSATGVYQVLDDTWLETVKDDAFVRTVKVNMGVDLAGKPDNELLAMRADPRMSAYVAASIAQKNKTALEGSLKRPVSEAEMYMAHVLGAGGATAFIRAYQDNKNAVAAELLPAAANANEGLFYQGGKPLTVGQMYDGMVVRFSGAPGRVGYETAQAFNRIAGAKEKGLKTNTVAFSNLPVTPLDQPNAYEVRGTIWKTNGEMYSLPNSDNKPFNTDTEVADLSKRLVDGSADDAITVLTNLARMNKTGSGSFDAGMDQLGQKNTSYAIAGQLMMQAEPDYNTAVAIVNGQKRINADKSTAPPYMGAEKDQTEAFNRKVGSSLSSMAPNVRETLFQAARAHYAETQATAGKFSRTAFEDSVDKVMGGKGQTRFGEVNGTVTILPQGVTERQMGRAIDFVTDNDLQRLSVDERGNVTNLPPMYANGSTVSALEFSTQARLKFVGADTYQVFMSDGLTLVTERPGPNGNLRPYFIQLTKPVVVDLASRTDGQNVTGSDIISRARAAGATSRALENDMLKGVDSFERRLRGGQ